MQCAVCDFENMSDQQRCVRCGAQLILTGQEMAEDYMPPRSKGSRKLRPVQYFFNRMLEKKDFGLLGRLARFFGKSNMLPGWSIAAMLFSVIPGLGHLLDSRIKSGVISFSVWVGFAIMVALHCVGVVGTVLSGMMFGWHASVVFHAGRIKEHIIDTRKRIRTVLAILVVTFTIYALIFITIYSYIDFMTCAFDVAALDLRKGDTLLIREGRFKAEDLQRGDIISVNFSSLRDSGGYGIRISDVGAAEVLGLPGDKIQISSEGFTVNSDLIEPDMLAKGSLPMPDVAISIIVPESHVYAVCPFGGKIEGRVAVRVWRDLLVIKAEEIQGKAIGIYLPMYRRHFF